MESQDVQTEKKVGTQALEANGLLQVAIAGGEHAHVRVQESLGAQRAVDLLLEETQKFRLDTEPQGIDLIQEERAALGQRDQPFAAAVGVGERAPLVAEHFILEQKLRQRAAVDRDEGPRAAPAELMDGSGRELPCRFPSHL